jgi:hypothetical protein
LQKALSGREGTRRSEGTIGARARELIRDCPPELQNQVMELFIEENKRFLTTFNLPWFIPEWMGGLGLPSISKRYSASELDYRIAHAILLNWKKSRPQLIPAEGSWHIRKLASQRHPTDVPEYRVEKGTGYQNLEEVNGLLAVNLLFDSNKHITDIFYEPDRDIKSIYRHNEKLWSPARWKGILPPPLTKEELEYLPKIGMINLTSVGRRPLTAEVSLASELQSLQDQYIIETFTKSEGLIDLLD